MSETNVDELLGTASQETPKAAAPKAAAPKAAAPKKSGASVPHYVFKCRGRYYTEKDAKTKERKTKSFVIDAKVPNLDIFEQVKVVRDGNTKGENGETIPKFKEVRLTNYLGVLRKKLLPSLLRRQKEHADCERLHTLYVDEVEFKNGAKPFNVPVKMMSRKLLKEFIALNMIPLNADDYVEIADLRSDVDLYIEAPHTFKATIALRQSKRSQEDEFLAFNS